MKLVVILKDEAPNIPFPAWSHSVELPLMSRTDANKIAGMVTRFARQYIADRKEKPMKIRIEILKSDMHSWEGSPEYTALVPEGLSAEDIDHLPRNLGLQAVRDMDNLINQQARKSYEENRIHRRNNEISMIKIGLQEMLKRLEKLDADKDTVI